MHKSICPIGRGEAAALTSMNVRAVIAASGVTFVAVPARLRRDTAPQGVGPRFQPRDPAGRFIPYAVLRDSILSEYSLTRYKYDLADYRRGVL